MDGKIIPFGTNIIIQDLKRNIRVGVEICEDLWAITPPSSNHALNGANVIVNLSASDEYLGKNIYRKDLVKSQSARTLSAYVYSSSGPSESSSDLCYSGHMLIAENGSILVDELDYSLNTRIAYADIDLDLLENKRLRNNSFRRNYYKYDYTHIDISIPTEKKLKLNRKINAQPFVPQDISKRKEVCDEITSIQGAALLKRLKHINTNKVIIGVSGGLDSTLALMSIYNCFLNNNISISNIIAVTMPGFGTSNRTKNNAVKLCEKLGISIRNIDISKSVKQHFKDIKHDENNYNIVFENAQARERTQILMDIANQENGIVIGTGDLSELALGWCTFNADQISMYGLNGGIPKTLISYLIHNHKENIADKKIKKILQDIIDTPISPELLPLNEKGEIEQETEMTIGVYELHDFFLYHVIRNSFTPSKILMLAETAFKNKYKVAQIKETMIIFYQRFFSNQYKRNLMPDTIKIGSISLSPRGDWRMPSDADMKIWINDIKNIK